MMRKKALKEGQFDFDRLTHTQSWHHLLNDVPTVFVHFFISWSQQWSGQCNSRQNGRTEVVVRL